MRAFLLVLTLAIVGCDSWWAGYLVSVPTTTDMGPPASDLGMACPAAGPDDGGPPAGCTASAQCLISTPYCDLNTGSCEISAPPSAAFPAGAPFETSIPLSSHFVLMATGDYDGDGVTDVVVSGVFTGPPNATGAAPAPVQLWRADGAGSLTHVDDCVLPAGEAPVFLLTVPGNCSQQDLLVATYGANIYRCTRASGSWVASVIGNFGVLPGFKRLALANDVGRVTPDLIILTSKNLFMETVDPATQGSLDVQRTHGGYTFNASASQASSTDISWATPLRLAGGAGDTLALTWDNLANAVGKRGVEFYYTDAVNLTKTLGFSDPVYLAGTSFPEFTKPYRTTAVLHVPDQDPSLLCVYSQAPNFLAVLYGTTAPAFTVQASTMLSQSGLMLPYAGDANSDGRDEIGVYTMALNGNALTRELALFSYKSAMVDTANPIVDITSTTEDFRAMTLDYLGKAPDRRRAALRKDLIALVDNPVGTASRLLIRRANLNHLFP